MFVEIVRVFFALAITLGLLGLGVVALRRFGPETIRRFQGPRPDRRLTVVETLVLDPARRLVLVRIDNEERLILLGEGRLLSTHPKPGFADSPIPASPTPALEEPAS